MKLIIDIPEKDFNACKFFAKNCIPTWLEDIIAKGKPYEERPQGMWRSCKQGDIPITDRCTNCNYEMKWYKNKHKYCPNCGADMRGEE